MKFKPTEKQRLAIEQNTPLLVCAAAGSGKTAVLAKRAARLLSDPISPISADRLLIVTFTNAAAAEMRDRIESYVDELCETEPANKFLLKQKLMLETAKICTIDSFCIDFVRENSEAADVEPDFRMLDQFELDDICDSALADVFNKHYVDSDRDFLDVLDAFGADYGDSNLAEAVLYVYNYTRNLPFPKSWLKNASLKCAAVKNINESFYADKIYRRVKEIAELQKRKIATALKKAEEVGSADIYAGVFGYINSFFSKISVLCDEENWNALYNQLNSYSPDRLPTVKDEFLKPFANAAKTLKSDLKTAVGDCSKLIYNDESSVVFEQNRAGKFVRILIKLVLEVEQKIGEFMKEKNAYTFYNTEQMTLELLAQKQGKQFVPTQLALDLQNKYAEIMVDEYQDVNNLQDTIFRILSGDDENLFAVGDDKQSIYGFRGSNPENFTEKIKSGRMNRVNMSGNFRSRPKVCKFINDVFSVIYPDYDESVYLDAMGAFPENDKTGCEIIFTEGDKNAVENEAEAIADYINELVLSKKPFLRDAENLRPATYGDIAVLMPTVKGKISAFLKAFKKYGIPVSSGGGDFASSTEVLIAMSLLRIADNPSYDAAALSVMMSYIGGFSAEDVAKIRLGDKKKSIYASVLEHAERGDRKCIRFVSLVKKMRSESISLPLSAFVDKAFRMSGIYELICAYGDGDMRRSNLLVICDMAASFEKTSGSSLSRFLSYMERVLKNDFASPVSLPGGNNVKIMSIHASKGLQFPICIVSGMSERFNYSSGKNSVAADDELGIALRFTEEEKRERFVSPAKLIMAEKTNKKLYDEKKRLLYVALTRAEELLVLTVNENYSGKAFASDIDRVYLSMGDSWPFERIAGNFASMILPTLTDEGMNGIYSINRRQIKTDNKTVQKAEYIPSPDNTTVEKIKDAFRFEYKYSALNQLEVKTSVSAVVRKDHEYSSFTARPAFMSEFGLTPAQRGTAMHKFMEVADYSAASKDIEAEIERLREFEYLTDIAAESLDREKLSKFFSSELYKRYSQAEYSKREMRFLTEMTVGELRPEISDDLSQEKILVQGAVDMLFYEDDGLVIVDFKTDRGKTAEQLKAEHSAQLKLYAAACCGITGKRIRELVIYSFDLGQAIVI